jgi:hypothetical protein
MADEERHFPPGSEPAPEAPAPTPEKESDEAPEEEAPEGDTSEQDEEKPPEAEKPKDEAEPESKPPLPKKRSIYDDLKDERKDHKATKSELEIAKEKNAELEALLDAKDDAKTPTEKKEAAKDIKEYAEKHGLDAEGVEELANIITAKIPKPDSVLTPEEAEQWRADRAKAARSEEDRAILDTAPAIKTQLGIHDDAELQAVMKEVVRLAHTTEFHDKEVDYIIWKNRVSLEKLVSPKRPSFEQGGQPGEAAADVEPDFSKTKGITPEMASRSNTTARPSLEVRRGSQVIK